MSASSPDRGVRRSTAARTGRAAREAVVAAVRPQASPWVPPWARWPWAVRLLPVATGLYATIVAISAAPSVFDNRFGTNGGIAFLLLLPAVAGLAAAPSRPLDGWLL